MLPLASHVEPRADDAAKSIVVPELGSKPPRLVGRKRIHRIEDDRLDAGLAPMSVAMIEDREEKALRLARSRARRDQGILRRARIARREALPRLELVGIREKWRLDGEGNRVSLVRLAKREANVHIRTAKKAGRPPEKREELRCERRVAKAEGRLEVVLERRADLFGQNGGDHGWSDRRFRATITLPLSSSKLPSSKLPSTGSTRSWLGLCEAAAHCESGWRSPSSR